MPEKPTNVYRTRSDACVESALVTIRIERAFLSADILYAAHSATPVVVNYEQPRCCTCGYKGRLYRPTDEFHRVESTRCKRCLAHVKIVQISYYGKDIDRPEWYAPLRINEANGLAWSWSGPWDPDKRRESFERWFALADNV